MNKSCSSVPACRNCIYDIIAKIDQIQKKASLQHECEGCDGPLTRELYNTRPLTCYLCNGEAFSARIPGTSGDTTLFRVEEIRGDCVTLRLLHRTGPSITCTNYTCVLNLCCVCGIQCFDPICCEPCMRPCPGISV